MDSVAPLLGTLEETGHLYNPFSTSDVWGQPRTTSFLPHKHQELPVGHDSSALPSLAQPEMHRDYKFGSAAPYVPMSTPAQVRSADSTKYLIAFGVVIALALYYKF